jgi:hypothetical protein
MIFMSESKKEKFARLAIKRVNRAINELRLVGNLANRSHYDYSDEDVRRICRALEEEMRAMRSRFESRSPARDTEFTL